MILSTTFIITILCSSTRHILHILVCLFVVLHPTREFFTHNETSPLPVKALLFDLWSALMARFFNVPYLLWHGSSVYNGHHTRTCFRALGGEAVNTCFNALGLSLLRIKPRSPACEVNALSLIQRGGYIS